MAHQENCQGVQSYASWDKTCDINHRAIAEYSWNFEATGDPVNFRKRYSAFLFPNQSDKAERAFSILADMVEGRVTWPSDDHPDFAIGDVIRYKLAYYMYSYVAKDMEYPRNFSGEAMVNLLAHRKHLEPEFAKTSVKLNEAYKIFNSLRNDPTGDTELARRYAAELRNYRDMVDDYLALFKVHDLLNSETENDAQAKIAVIAKERKLERYALIAEMEDFKEEYLHASHLRNQSLFMQVFADIEAYAKKTPKEEFTLDVTDLRPIASEMMNIMR
jgi:hypothetical protein